MQTPTGSGAKGVQRHRSLSFTAAVSFVGLAAYGSVDRNQAPTPYAFPSVRPGVKVSKGYSSFRVV
jgi:hypothetical protein